MPSTYKAKTTARPAGQCHEYDWMAQRHGVLEGYDAIATTSRRSVLSHDYSFSTANMIEGMLTPDSQGSLAFS